MLRILVALQILVAAMLLAAIYATAGEDEWPNPCELNPYAECVNPVGYFGPEFGFAYKSSDFPRRPPTEIIDFFDVKRFSGKRVLLASPRGSLEMALIADGILPEKVYDVLKTREGEERAFSKLSTIKDHIIWRSSLESFPNVQSGDAKMAMIYSDRLMGWNTDSECDPETSPVGMEAATTFWEGNAELAERFNAWLAK